MEILNVNYSIICKKCLNHSKYVKELFLDKFYVEKKKGNQTQIQGHSCIKEYNYFKQQLFESYSSSERLTYK